MSSSSNGSKLFTINASGGGFFSSSQSISGSSKKSQKISQQQEESGKLAAIPSFRNRKTFNSSNRLQTQATEGWVKVVVSSDSEEDGDRYVLCSSGNSSDLEKSEKEPDLAYSNESSDSEEDIDRYVLSSSESSSDSEKSEEESDLSHGNESLEIVFAPTLQPTAEMPNEVLGELSNEINQTLDATIK